MTPPPARPMVYHITHVDNLASIVAAAQLVCHAVIGMQGGPAAAIGMTGIKQFRLSLPVKCHPGDRVGDYVPFYFCPRSIMLFVIHRGNHPGLTYRGGQDPIVHLEADLHDVVAWAGRVGRRWAFTLSNAGARYAEFRASTSALDEIDWGAVAARDFRDPAVKEAKQAEFLVHGSFPWQLVERIGTHSQAVQAGAAAAIAHMGHRPPVDVCPDWYY
jgi:hypothetical protein